MSSRGEPARWTTTTPAGELSIADWPGADPVVLALHGRAGHGREWDRLAAALVDRRILAADLRGHGESNWTSDYLIESMVDDVLHCLDATGAGRVDVVGHSLGGLIAMVLAAREPERVRRLVVADIGPVLPRGAAAALNDPPPDDFASPQDAVVHLRSQHPVAPDDVLARRVEHGLVPAPNDRWRWRHDPALDHLTSDPTFTRLWDHWDAIEVPVLIVRGGQSAILSADLAAEMAERGFACELSVVPRAGHDVHTDLPERFGDLVQSFLHR